MHPSYTYANLRCPKTQQRLIREATGLRTLDRCIFYPDRDGILSLVYPQNLSGEDEKMNRFYEWFAPFYDLSERYLGWLLTGVDMAKGREEIVRLLGLSSGATLLEVSPGPGVFSPYLRDAVGETGVIVSADLSLNMLRQYRKNHDQQGALLIQANAHHLPFEDNTFDALFHFGGINLFNEPTKALDEFVRVVRHGGIVAWGDEQMSPHFSHPLGRKVLPRLNPGFLKTPPPPPQGIRDLCCYTVYEGLGYFNVGIKDATAIIPHI